MDKEDHYCRKQIYAKNLRQQKSTSHDYTVVTTEYRLEKELKINDAPVGTPKLRYFICIMQCRISIFLRYSTECGRISRCLFSCVQTKMVSHTSSLERNPISIHIQIFT